MLSAALHVVTLHLHREESERNLDLFVRVEEHRRAVEQKPALDVRLNTCCTSYDRLAFYGRWYWYCCTSAVCHYCFTLYACRCRLNTEQTNAVSSSLSVRLKPAVSATCRGQYTVVSSGRTVSRGRQTRPDQTRTCTANVVQCFRQALGSAMIASSASAKWIVNVCSVLYGLRSENWKNEHSPNAA
jgi:hypothetical protein